MFLHFAAALAVFRIHGIRLGQLSHTAIPSMAASEQLRRDAQDKLARWIDLDQRVVRTFPFITSVDIR